MTMPSTGFKVTFVTNVFRGRDANGTPEPLPDTARLFSALVSAAARTPKGLDGYRSALEWFEYTPPTYMTVPSGVHQMCDTVQHFMSNPTYTAKNRAKSGEPKTPPRRYITEDDYAYGYVIEGNIEWGWEDAPTEHASKFAELTRFIPYVGDPDSVVKVAWGTLEEPTHVLADEDELPVRGSVQGFAPVPGRLTELDERRDRIMAGKGRNDSDAAAAVREINNLSRDARRNVASIVYNPVEVPTVPALDAPWDVAVWFPLKKDSPRKDIPVEKCTEAAGMLHRNLVRLFSNTYHERCAVLHGHKEEQAKKEKQNEQVTLRTVNNVAFQFIPDGYRHAGGDTAGLMVLIPRDAPLGDRDALCEMLTNYRMVEYLFGRNSRIEFERTGTLVDPTRWWSGTPVGSRRVWKTLSLAISEGVGAPLTALAAQSLRYVFRDQMSLKGAAQCVIGVERVDPHTGIQAFIHRTSLGVNESLGRRHLAFSAVYDLDKVSPDSAVLAVGQSRHFGAGLLVPVDVPIT